MAQNPQDIMIKVYNFVMYIGVKWYNSCILGGGCWNGKWSTNIHEIICGLKVEYWMITPIDITKRWLFWIIVSYGWYLMNIFVFAACRKGADKNPGMNSFKQRLHFTWSSLTCAYYIIFKRRENKYSLFKVHLWSWYLPCCKCDLTMHSLYKMRSVQTVFTIERM